MISSGSELGEVLEPNSAPRKEQDPVDHHQLALEQKVSDELVDVAGALNWKERFEGVVYS